MGDPEWMRALPNWPAGVHDRDGLLRWLAGEGMTIAEFKQTDIYTAHVREWVGVDPVTGEGGRLRFPWLSEL